MSTVRTSNAYLSLPDILSARAQIVPTLPLYTYVDSLLTTRHIWTYASLLRRVTAIASHLERTCAVGDRVIILMPHSPHFISTFLGCLAAGIVPVPLPPPRGVLGRKALRAIFEETAAKAVFTTQEFETENIMEQECIKAEVLEIVRPDDIADECGDSLPEYVQKNGVMYLQYTSGSTLHPRGVMISAENLKANLLAIDEDFRHDEGSISVTWLPHFHDMGLVYGLLQPLYTGFKAIVLAPEGFIRRPMSWLQAISRFRATHSGGPNFAFQLCVDRADGADMSLDLNSWRTAFCGAEPVRPLTLKRFAQCFSGNGFKSTGFYPTYGLAEATLKVTGRYLDGELIEADETGEINARSVACGIPDSRTTVRIVDPDTLCECSLGEIGEIWIAGPGVANGYWRGERHSSRTFGARLINASPEDTVRSFLRTGDTGFLGPRGLVVCGRTKDVLVVRGRCYYAEDLEWTLLAKCRAEVRTTFAAFSTDSDDEERVVIMQECSVRSPDLIHSFASRIRKSVAEEHSLQVHAVAFVRRIPKTSSGKVARHRCREIYEQGSADIHTVVKLGNSEDQREGSLSPKLDHTGLQETLRYQLARSLRLTREQLGAVTLFEPLSSLGCDSVGALEISHFIQQTYHCQISPSKLLSMCLSALVNEVSKRSETGSDKHLSQVAEYRASDAAPAYISPEQHRFWCLQRFAPQNTSLNISVGFEVHGSVDLGLFCEAVLCVLHANERLRTRFREADDLLEPEVLSADEFRPIFIDLTAMANACGAIYENTIREFNAPFNLRNGPLCRIGVIKIQAERWSIVFAFHHCIVDWPSVRLVVQDIWSSYRGLAGLSPPPPNIRRYNNTQQRIAFVEATSLQGPALENALAYWRVQLAKAPAALSIANKLELVGSRSNTAKEYVIAIDPETYRGLKLLAAKLGVTPYVIHFSTYAVALWMAEHTDDVIIATPFSNRDRVELGTFVGLLATLVPVRIRMNEKASFHDVCKQIKKSVDDASDHPIVPYGVLVHFLKPARVRGRMPLAQVYFDLSQDLQLETGSADLAIEPFFVPNSHADFDVALQVLDCFSKYLVRLRVAIDMVDEKRAAELLANYSRIIAQAVVDPNRQLDRCDINVSDSGV